MSPEQASAQSFLVRVWLEDIASDDGAATWRGHITELPDGRPLYFEELERMSEVIAARLRAMGVATP